MDHPKNQPLIDRLSIERFCTREAGGQRRLRQNPILLRLSFSEAEDLRSAASLMADELRYLLVPVEYTLKPVFRPRPTVNCGRYSRRLMFFPEAVNRVRASPLLGPSYYISGLPLSALSTGLSDSISKLASHFPSKPAEKLLFIGGANSGTFLHYDLTDNMLVVVSGEKEVQLISPDSNNTVIPHHAIQHCRRYANLPGDTKGLAVIPPGAKITTVRIQAGQALWIPAHWWHQVWNCDLSTGVSLVWRRPWLQLRRWAGMRCYLGALGSHLNHAARRLKGIATT
jgi:cupin-like protein